MSTHQLKLLLFEHDLYLELLKTNIDTDTGNFHLQIASLITKSNTSQSSSSVGGSRQQPLSAEVIHEEDEDGGGSVMQ